ncbi:MAG: DUF523 domain-containing protein [Bacilli bacterium]|jgi:uncharacterized protein YbbK (DUF523 family)|nr:DUF523 domain-containing protein [Bacilli bacterium]
MNKIGVSSCLLNKICRYDGKKLNVDISSLLEDYEIIDFCPELLGGLSCPRLPCEIINGDGYDVLNNKAQVINSNNEDLSYYFIKGAQLSLDILKKQNIDKVILKSNSPSCGNNYIYSGNFNNEIKKGIGVCAAYLKNNGIKVLSEKDFNL